MRKVDLRAVVMPPRVHNEVNRLLAAIEVAETRQALTVTATRAEGFVLGLETSGGFRSDLIETMYIGFETAVEAQRAVISAI